MSAEIERAIDDADRAILFALDEHPFACMRELSRLTYLPSPTVDCRLRQSLGGRARHLRWVPNALSDAQRADRMDLSRRLLAMLKVWRDLAWHDMVTLDESWFPLSRS
jgi:hypothetical protein